MTANAVPGFLPSRNGFHFANHWPSVPALWFGVGLLHVGLGNAARGLCGGMVFAARDRFERGEPPPPDAVAPAGGTPLFGEIVGRQVDSFDRLVLVPFRFWRAAAWAEGDRLRHSVSRAWPAIRAEIDGGRLAMLGLVRVPSRNPLATRLGHQVAAYAYDESPTGVTLRIYDPNHPDDDAVTVTIERDAAGQVRLAQSTGEPVACLLALPYRPAR